tara:strand:- start:414 stop:626 length:213 start_codon:yes stop_codon:yes gene_type:complete
MKKILVVIFILTFSTSYAQSSDECKQYKKLSKNYFKCLGGKLKGKSSGVGLDTSNIKEKKTLSDWFKKKK